MDTVACHPDPCTQDEHSLPHPRTFGVLAAASILELSYGLKTSLPQPLKSALPKVMSHSQNQPGSCGQQIKKEGWILFPGVGRFWRGIYQILWCLYHYCFPSVLFPWLPSFSLRCGSRLNTNLSSILIFFPVVPFQDKQKQWDGHHELPLFACYWK